jgi:peptide subunit release factor 1 (eRF1)
MDFDEADGFLISRAEETVLKDEKETVSKNVARLKEEILKHGLAVYGLNDIIDAVKKGHIELLRVSKGYKLKAGYARNAAFRFRYK